MESSQHGRDRPLPSAVVKEFRRHFPPMSYRLLSQISENVTLGSICAFPKKRCGDLCATRLNQDGPGRGPKEGTGIGLFMSKVIIEKGMMGSITVHNIAGGAEFRIEV